MWASHFGMEPDKANRVHPTQKPIRLCEKFIERYSRKSKIVVDLFGGSGSTLIACQKQERTCYMLEYEAEYVDHQDWMRLRQSPLTTAKNERPLYTRDSGGIFVIGDNNDQVLSGVTCNYVKQPGKVEWGYDVINEMALYQPATSVNFEHHSSDETELVMKILELAGIVMNKPGLVQLAGSEEIQKIQQEKM